MPARETDPAIGASNVDIVCERRHRVRMATIVKSIRVGAALDARVKAVLLDSRQDQKTTRRPMKEAEALGIALEIGLQGLERRTVGWSWRCDHYACYNLIESVRDGVVQWVDVDGAYRDLQVVHAGQHPHYPHQRCVFNVREEQKKDNGIVVTYSLSEVLGPDGFLFMNDLSKAKWIGESKVENVWKRLFVPGYEQVYHPPYVSMALMSSVIKRGMGAASDMRLADIEAMARWMVAREPEGTMHDDGLRALRILGKSPDVATDNDDE